MPSQRAYIGAAILTVILAVMARHPVCHGIQEAEDQNDSVTGMHFDSKDQGPAAPLRTGQVACTKAT